MFQTAYGIPSMKISLPATSSLQNVDFTFGVATAAFQIEGAAESRLECIWDTFCATPGKIKDASNGLVACKHYELWQQDLDLIESLGVDAYRFSISWPRVIKRDGSLSPLGVDFYIKILDSLKKRGIKAYVTLYHWDLPQHMEDQGGWLNRQTAYLFRDYVDQITKAFGSRVYSYATLNEPFCSAYLGYEVGIHAPGLMGIAKGKRAAHHLLLAHGLAMQVLEKNSPNSLNGIVLNVSPCFAATDSAEDQAAARLVDQRTNQWFAQPLLEGRYPALFDELDAADRPPVEAGDMAIIAHKLDFLGVNYYTREMVAYDDQLGTKKVYPDDLPLTDMGWEVYPQGLTEILVYLDKQFELPPIYITENGAALPDGYADGEANDVRRVAYFQSHLEAVHQAIEQGVNVQGYFAWSLMDNFEWAEGYVKRFGIVHVDYVTQKRTIKASGFAYRDFIGQRQSKKAKVS
jgi:beta-glucosidase